MGFITYSQSDSRWGKKNYNGSSTMATAGCGPTSCAMIIYGIDGKTTPLDTMKYMQNNGFAIRNNGTAWNGIPSCLKAFGLKDVQNVPNMTKCWELMNKGYVGVFLFRSGSRGGVTWTTSGHYIAVTDYKVQNGKHYIYTRDSGGRNHTGWYCYETQMCGLIPQIWLGKIEETTKEASLTDKEVYFHNDQKARQCMITSMVNAMRRRQIRHNAKWENITITNALKQGAKQSGYTCTFNGVTFKIVYRDWAKADRTKTGLAKLLKEHPAGVAIYGAKTSTATKKSGTAHGVLITDIKDGIIYGVNPSHNGTRYGYTKTTGKGIERFDKMNMRTELSRYSKISYLEVQK